MRAVNLRRISLRFLLAFLLGALTAGCGSEEPEAAAPWQLVHESLPGALLSVWGTSPSDVWAVGTDASDGKGPTVLHFDGAAWTQLETGEVGDLWWVFGFDAGPVYLGGAGGMILRYEDGAFTRMTTPGRGVVFGLWGAAPNDMWAVGGEAGGAQGAFAWRLAGDTWSAAPEFPTELAATSSLWKVYGQGSDDVWMVGTGGRTLHWDGTTLDASFTGIAESLFTVHASSERFATVGGFGTGLLLERSTGADASSAWVDASPEGAPSLIGVCLTEPDGGYAVGEFGYVASRRSSGWQTETTGFELELGIRSLHSVWVDPSGGVWTVGGQIRVPPLVDGVMLHRGAHVPGTETLR